MQSEHSCDMRQRFDVDDSVEFCSETSRTPACLSASGTLGCGSYQQFSQVGRHGQDGAKRNVASVVVWALDSTSVHAEQMQNFTSQQRQQNFEVGLAFCVVSESTYRSCCIYTKGNRGSGCTSRHRHVGLALDNPQVLFARFQQ